MLSVASMSRPCSLMVLRMMSTLRDTNSFDAPSALSSAHHFSSKPSSSCAAGPTGMYPGLAERMRVVRLSGPRRAISISRQVTRVT